MPVQNQETPPPHQAERGDSRCREFALHSVMLLAVLFVLFPGVFLRGESAFPGGLFLREDPWIRYAPEGSEVPLNVQVLDYSSGYDILYNAMEKALAQGEWPLWNPHISCGAPLLASYQVAPFYPLRWFNVFFDHYAAATLLLLSRLWICGMVAYICGRAFGLGVGASRFLSFGWMLLGYNALWVYWTIPEVSAWFPVLFVGAEWILAGRYRRGFFAVLLGAVLSLFAGHPESLMGFNLGLGAYFLLRLAWRWDGSKQAVKALCVLASAWTVALLVVSVQVLPFLEYVKNSSTFEERLQGASNERIVPPLSGEALVAFWVPRFFGATTDDNVWHLTRESPFAKGEQIPRNTNFIGLIYPGIAVWFALTPFFLRKGVSRMNRIRLFCMVPVCLVGLLLAIDHPIVAFAYHLPLARTMHRVYHVCFLLFALPFAGALGVQEWFSRPRRLRELMPAALIGAVIAFHVLLLTAIYFVTISSSDLTSYVFHQIALAALFALLATGVMAAHCVVRRPQFLVFLMGAILVADQVVALRDMHPTMPRSHIHVETRLLPYMASLPGPARFNILSALLMDGPQVYYDIEQLWGYDALYPARVRTFLSLSDRPAWNKLEPIAAVTYYLFREGLVTEDNPDYELLARLDGFDVCKNRHAFPRIRLVGRLETVADKQSVLERMCEPDFDPAAAAVTEVRLTQPLPDSDSGGLGTANIMEKTSTRCRIDVDAQEPCVMVLADSYFPGWKAWIDDSPAEMFPVYYAFRGVVVPEGRHTVRIEYHPFSFRIGMAVSVVSLLGCATVALLVILRQLRTARARYQRP